MKLLHLYSGNLYGGVERLLGSLQRLQSVYPALQHQFGLCFRGKLWEELTRDGASVLDLGEVRTRYPWTVLRARRRLAEHLRTNPPDWVICHTPWPQAVFGGMLCRRGIKMAVMYHDVPRQSWLDRWASWSRPRLSVANSQHIGEQVRRVLPSPVPVILHCPTELRSLPSPNQRAALREALGVVPNDVVILQASRFERWKGLHVFVEALGLLKGIPGWTAWLAGEPQKPGEHEYREELQARAKTCGVADRLHFLGWRPDVPELMHAADIVCQPNVGPEPFGLVFVEALSMGRPVVATAIGGAKEIITPETGILVEPNQPEPLAAALRRLIEDSATRQRLGAAGPSRARELVEPQRQLRRLHELLEQHA